MLIRYGIGSAYRIAEMSEEERKIYISLGQAADGTPYSQEYLSLLVRKGKLDARKFGRNWYTTKTAVAAYAARQRETLIKKVNDNGGSTPNDFLAPQASYTISDAIRYPALRAEKEISVKMATTRRFFAHIAQEGVVLGLALAVSTVAGIAGVRGVQEWQAARTSAIVTERGSDFRNAKIAAV